MAAVENKDEDIKLDEKDKRIKRLERQVPKGLWTTIYLLPM